MCSNQIFEKKERPSAIEKLLIKILIEEIQPIILEETDFQPRFRLTPNAF